MSEQPEPGDEKTSPRPPELFLARLQALAATFSSLVSTADREWIVKSFIDVYRNIYTISGDTKVVSKIIELTLFPYFDEFARTYGSKMILSKEQNHYPDMTFIDHLENRFALDLKSTYRIEEDRVNTMTLGVFTGYFRLRESSKNVAFPYGSYAGHFVLGVIYSRAEVRADEFMLHALDDLDGIPSVIRDIEFFAQPKHRIAKDLPGSGNTTNIGAVNSLSNLISGSGPFAELGEAVFDDYWMFYLTADMARRQESKRPYSNLASYHRYKSGPVEGEGDEL